MYPPDEKGGTWICATSSGRVVCLLNGGFEKHKHQPPYQFSRGLVVLGLAAAASIKSYISEVLLTNVEPFTIIARDTYDFLQWVWDGNSSHIHHLDKTSNYIWSSSTLYIHEQKQRRTDAFKNFISDNIVFKEDVLSFHKSQPFQEAETDFLMKRPGVETIAVTQIAVSGENIDFVYHNLVNNSTLISQLSI